MGGPSSDTIEPPAEERGARARRFVEVLTRRAVIIAACALVIPLAAYLLVALQPQRHQANVVVQPGPLIPQNVLVSSQVPSGWFQSPSASFVALLAKTPPVRIEAAHLLRRSPAEIGSVTASPQTKTGWVTIGVTEDSSRAAVNAANAFAAATAQNLRVRTHRAIAILIANLEGQLAQQRDRSVRGEIRAQIAAFRAFRPADAQPLQVIVPADGAHPVSNRPGLAAALALVFALFLGWRLALLAERGDGRVHGLEEIEDVVGLPLLAVVQGEVNSSPEPLLRLRDSIRYLAGQRQATLVVTSPGKQEGRTSVAIGLAKAFTASGRTVVVVDADLRDPQVATRLAIAPRPGFADVIAGASLSDALHVGLHPGLTVLPAGAAIGAATDLADSGTMTSVIEELATRFDVVVVDTPPLFEVSDALALVHAATGVLLVARVGETNRRALRRATQLLTRTGAPLLGPIATGVHAHGHRLHAALPGSPARDVAVQAPGV